MRETMHRMRQWGNEPTLTKRKWTYGVTATLVVLCFGAAFGSYKYSEQREADAAALVRAECLRRADARSEIRGMFLTTFEVIEDATDNPNAFDNVRVRLDERYPPLDPADC